MSTPRRGIVQIINPVSGESRYTTRKSAMQLVRRGRAMWDADESAIRLTDQVQASNCGERGGAGQGFFQWHRGVSGGMAQVLGSQKYRADLQTRRPKENK
jgi:hypothetical protein